MTSNTIAPPTTDSAIIRESDLGSLPVDPSLLESANTWFDRSWYGLLLCGAATAILAMATVMFLFIQYWSSGVRERHTEWRTSALELKTAEANARAKEADLKLEQLRRLAGPRSLNHDVFLKELEGKPKAHVAIWYLPDTSDGWAFSIRLLGALRRAPILECLALLAAKLCRFRKGH
jgi:hypothetical protein